MRICAICYEPIYCFYYQSKCNCKLYYHLDCIIEWYRINRTCIQCRKKDTNTTHQINKKLNTLLQLVVLIMSCTMIIIMLLYNKLIQSSYWHCLT